MSMVDEQNKFMLDIAKLILYAVEKGWNLTGGELFRTPEQQEIYFKAGKSKTMKSNHLVRCALDINFFWEGQLCEDVDKLADLGHYWESLAPGKNRWGGFWKFKDTPHFERNVQG